ncbi:hypothetical protein E2C01_085950 [Portunus trituberculatus]|uniref:Uncharacterized protein n=1 Tax=Portunus trituberculatus TaxID=210409 RepID=A0A5B7JA97_PORTR|nr:hypothetical protein [Portunus trituberculatus]
MREARLRAANLFLSPDVSHLHTEQVTPRHESFNITLRQGFGKILLAARPGWAYRHVRQISTRGTSRRSLISYGRDIPRNIHHRRTV